MQKKKNNMMLLQQRFSSELLNNSIVLPGCLLEAYSQLGLNEYEFVQLLKLMNSAKTRKLAFEDIEKLCGLSSAAAEELQEKLINLNLLEADKEGNLCFDSLYNALFDFWVFTQMADGTDLSEVEKKPRTRSKGSKLIRAFEKEFGRALSPIEIEKLMQWVSIDKFPDNVIEEALQRAVMQGKLSFAYIDRILLNWKKSGFATVEEIKAKDSRKSGEKTKPADKKAGGSVYDKLMR